MVLTPRALELDARKARRNLYLAGQMTYKRRLCEAVFSPGLAEAIVRSRGQCVIPTAELVKDWMGRYA